MGGDRHEQELTEPELTEPERYAVLPLAGSRLTEQDDTALDQTTSRQELTDVPDFLVEACEGAS